MPARYFIGILLIPAIFLFIQPSFAEVSTDTQKYKESQKYFNEGMNFFKKGKYEKAIEAFKEVIKIRPDDERVYKGLGFAYGSLKQYENAIEAFKEAIRLNPNDAGTYYNLGLTFFFLGKYEQAIEAYKESIKLKPDKAVVYQSLGSAYTNLKQFEKAIESYKEAIKLKPDDAMIYQSLGFVYGNLEQYEKAIKAFKEAIKLKPDDAFYYISLGFIYEKLGQYENAIEAFKEAIKLKPDDALAYVFLGNNYDKLGQYEKAVEAYKEAIRLDPKHAEAYSGLGMVFLALKKYEQAIEICKEALKLNLATDGIYFVLGNSYHSLGQYDKAVEAYKEALKLKPDSAEVYTRLGQALFGLGQDEQAIEAHKKSIEINPDYAEGYFELGSLYSVLDKFTESIEYLNSALNLYKKFSNREGEAKVLLELATTYLNQGKDIYAMSYLQSALTIYQEVQNKKGEEDTLIEISSVYSLLGEYDTALEYQKKALAVFQKLEDTDSIIDTLITLASTKFSIEEGSSKNYEEPIKYIKQAIELAEKTELENDPTIVVAYFALGGIYLASKDYENAMEYIRKSLTLAEGIEYKPLYAYSLFYMGLAYENLDNYQQALEYYQKAVNLFNEIGKIKWNIIGTLGNINDKLGNITEAKSNYLRAINIFELERGNKQSLALKISFAESATVLYHDTILLLLKTNEPSEAFNYMERAKARVFLDLLGGKLKLQNKEIIEEERRLQFRINYLAEKIREANERPDKKVSPQLVISFEKQLNDARLEYASLIEKIKKENPELSTLLTVNPLTLKEIQTLLDPDTTLLEYFITPDKTLLWVVDKQDLKVISIDIKSKELASKVEAYREKISKFQPDYKKDADDLYTLLIKPAKPYIKTKRIGIVPHSVLHYLPFQALLNQEKFLIEEYDIFYTPSASVLKFVYEKRKEIKGKILAFGNPKLEDEKLDLPYAEDEVKKIKTTYPETSLYLREKATEDKAKKLSGNYNIVHFASHGELNPTAPMFSSIRLAKEKDEDGRLEINEIFNLDLKNTSLVTLSACETGLGKLTEGDELVGLARGFIYAGTPSIVASLWSVNDQSTSELMNLFYKNLKNHPKSEALRMAQLEMIKGKTGKGIVRGVGGITTTKKGKPKEESTTTVDGSHPYFWAPFILLGDWK